MADHSHVAPVETGADMDYREHEHTYRLFLTVVKYGSLVCIAILIAMAFGFFVSSAGFFSAAVVFLIVCALGGFLLR
ncbi:aa3 type cytochrome c oxidase subunit IV [Pseudaminobacter salicylatoxidans]|uniref:Aa3 type cytochrome c oxidase subunit IV n=1 Tax=Pseudaminobacter salicylatoxidans TaxID=93369 RepID=A0A316CLY5_PSESE|nr:aa3-type cytochrome c oxidase subunit IV [Pseudaminobacter salicylatoxidans]PWJ81036.1 aa3 type cytochrome c oxidase subunit IV [Pseudaminobacter salicylatoxidans]